MQDDIFKLIFISFNEAVQIKQVTGNLSSYTQIKTFLSKLASDERFTEFFQEFLSDKVINACPTLIKKMAEGNKFIQGSSFVSEVDA